VGAGGDAEMVKHIARSCVANPTIDLDRCDADAERAKTCELVECDTTAVSAGGTASPALESSPRAAVRMDNGRSTVTLRPTRCHGALDRV
jgi:hypothetical protein